MLKVVFDTSVYISALAIPSSKSEEAFVLAIDGKISLFTSPAILAETATKLHQKFNIPEDEVTIAIRRISHSADVVRPRIKITALEDTPDNRILECAVIAKADIIVTGDKHLLRLKSWQGIGIVRVADFLRIVS